MRLASVLRRGQLRRSPLAGFAFFAVVLLIAYKLSNFIIAGDMRDLELVGIAVLIGGVVVVILNNWRNGLYFFLAWLMFEDFARKFLGNNMAIYFAKDFLVAVVYLAFFLAYRRKDVQTFRPSFLVPLLLLVWFGLMQVFNPASPTVWYGVLGMKLFFYYVPLLFVGYALIDSEPALRRFFSINLLLALPIAGLGIAQSILGPTFLNPTNLESDIRSLSTTYRVAPITGEVVYRPNSVFVSTGRFGDFLIVTWFVTFGYCGYLMLRQKRGRPVAFLALAVTYAAVVLCASRGPFMWTTVGAIVVGGAFLWGAPWKQGEAKRIGRILFRAGLGVALVLILLLLTYPDALMGRLAVYSETLSPTSPASELALRARDYPLRNFLGAFNYPRWPYGYGIGTTALGTQYVARIFDTKPAVIGVESGFGTIVVEMGIGGLVLWLVMSVAILLAAWRVVRKLRGSVWFPLAFVILLYSFILLLPMTFVGIQAYEDFILNAYLWLLLGILFRLPSIAVSAQIAPAAPVLTPRSRWVR
jgi:hypothetical protein